MHNILNTIRNPILLSSLKAAIPPGAQFWRATCQILNKEYLKRPQYMPVEVTPANPVGKFALSSVYFDTILEIQDIERPEEFYGETRLQGRVEPVTVGDIVDVIGVYDGRLRRFNAPQLLVSRKAGHWWACAEIFRADHPCFEVEIVPEGDNHYDIEGKEWLNLGMQLPLSPEEETLAKSRAEERTLETLLTHIFEFGTDQVLDRDVMYKQFLREERAGLDKFVLLDRGLVYATYKAITRAIFRDTAPLPARPSHAPKADNLNLPPE